MQPQQIALVKSSWLAVVPIAATAADIFYSKLFELDPALRPMFPADLATQKEKLMATLGRVVSSLDRLQDVLPAVESLGRKHVGYGVRPAHYATVGTALLATLEAGLGAGWNEDVKAAWAAAYGALSSVMIAASETASASNSE